jgi:hypothetical protein
MSVGLYCSCGSGDCRWGVADCFFADWSGDQCRCGNEAYWACFLCVPFPVTLPNNKTVPEIAFALTFFKMDQVHQQFGIAERQTDLEAQPAEVSGANAERMAQAPSVPPTNERTHAHQQKTLLIQ